MGGVALAYFVASMGARGGWKRLTWPRGCTEADVMGGKVDAEGHGESGCVAWWRRPDRTVLL